MNALIEKLSRDFEAAARALPGSEGPLLSHRQAALADFRRTGLPTQRDEAWKYTPLRALQRREFALSRRETPGGLERPLPSMEGWQMVFVNGHFTPALSMLDGLPEDVVCLSLARALDTHGPLVDELLRQDFAGRDEAFALLNSAFLQDGVFLSVPDGVAMERPLHIVYAGVPGEVSFMSHLRNLIKLGAGARAMVVEHWLDLGEHQNLTNTLGFCSLDREAVLQHVRIQEDSSRGLIVDRLHVNQKSNSRYTGGGFDFGGQLVRHDLDLLLEEAEARCDLNGLYVLDGRAHVDNHTRIDHASPSCTSRERFKGVLGGRSRAVFNGKVVVRQGADGTDASQSNANLLLSEQAEVDTKPELEIYADEVRCSHGATVGQLDANALFYLRSRGIDEAAARGLLTRGFCVEILDRVGHAPARAVLEKRLDARLDALEGAGS